MPRSTPSLLVLAPLLAACRSSAPEPLDGGAWRSRIERTQENLARGIDELRTLALARALDPDRVTPAPYLDPELLATLAAMGERLARIEAVLASGQTDASHATDASWMDDPAGTDSIEALRQSLLVLEQRRSVHGKNLANADTYGYKRRLLRPAPSHGEPGEPTVPVASNVAVDMARGVLEQTGGQLDFAAEGPGFFQIELPNGELRYRRDGDFRLDLNGRVVTKEGFLLTDQVVVPRYALDVAVGRNGDVFALSADKTLARIGTIHLHVFPNPPALRAVRGNEFVPTLASGEPQARQPGVQGAGELRQGYLERSNVEFTRELVDLQLVERRARTLRHLLASRGVLTGV